MCEVKYSAARVAPEYMPSVYAPDSVMRARGLEGMVSVEVRDLFPKIPKAVYTDDSDDLEVVREMIRKALENVDMSMIKPWESVNILCAEHGCCLWGGKPYIEMLKTIKEVTFEKTGCLDIRLRVVMYRTAVEGREVLENYDILEDFDNKVDYCGAYDKGVAIETKIGTLYGIAKAYDADHIIYGYYDDPRELYAHRLYT